jgi:hypothetical protein
MSNREAQIEAQAEFHAHEMNTDADASWLRWLSAVERLTGIANLDGDLLVDGYSLDQCGDWFDADLSPSRAAAAILNSVGS